MNTKIIYWIVTVLFSLMMLASGGAQVAQVPEMVSSIKILQLPLSILPLVGIFKILGALVVALPMIRGDIKIAAYSGFTFLLVGAFYFHLVSDDLSNGFGTLIMLALNLGSYALYKTTQTKK
jgi:hypothetical protein